MFVFHVWVGVGGQEEFEEGGVVRCCCLAFSLMVFRSGTGRGMGGMGGWGERGGGSKSGEMLDT